MSPALETQPGDRWTSEEERLFAKLVNAGSFTWRQIADRFPNRTFDAVRSHRLSMEDSGKSAPASPKRSAPPGRGGAPGRPRNLEESAKVSLRLHASVREAMAATDLKPGQFLTLALERYVGRRRPLPEFVCEVGVLEPGRRTAASWCVSLELIERACEKSNKSHGMTAEIAIENVLKASGFLLPSRGRKA